MPSYRSAFPSKYLNASEVETAYDATIHEVTLENVGTAEKPETKLVAYFTDGHRPIVLNKTRAEAIEEMSGTDDYNHWSGVRVHVSKGSTRFNGKKVACIDLSAPDLPF